MSRYNCPDSDAKTITELSHFTLILKLSLKQYLSRDTD
jgi:hypothetical protein